MKAGQVVKGLREQKEWSQEELAHRTGSTAANISRIETGKHEPSIKLLKSIAKAFGLAGYQLMALAEGYSLPNVPSEYLNKEEQLVRLYRSASRERQRILIDICREFSQQNKKN